jgi:hypothetical protein
VAGTRRDYDRASGRWGRGSGLRRNVIPIIVLVLVLGGYEAVTRQLSVPARAIDLEAASASVGWQPPMAGQDVAYDIYLRVNDERAARGLPALTWHEGLASLARQWSEEMIETSYRHSTAEWRHHQDFAGSGENIFMGPRDATEGHVGWMESDGHRDNILHLGYTAVGIGVVCRNDGHMWATQIFGVPHGSASPPPPPTAMEPIVRRDEGGPACPVVRRVPW